MLIIYFKSDGEIHQVAQGYKSMEEYYGFRADEFSLIFDALYIEEANDYIFNRFTDFRIDVKARQLKMIDNAALKSILNN